MCVPPRFAESAEAPEGIEGGPRGLPGGEPALSWVLLPPTPPQWIKSPIPLLSFSFPVALRRVGRRRSSLVEQPLGWFWVPWGPSGVRTSVLPPPVPEGGGGGGLCHFVVS